MRLFLFALRRGQNEKNNLRALYTVRFFGYFRVKTEENSIKKILTTFVSEDFQ